MKFVYLASPYTPIAGESVQERVDAACRAAAELMQQGHAVFAPVPHSHYIADHLPAALRMDHEHWMRQDLAVLRHADRLVVLRLPGWDQSRGIGREMSEAALLNIPVTFMDPAFTEREQAAKVDSGESVLEEAQRLVYGERGEDYGHPLDDFGRTAAMWSAILGVTVTAEQVGLCMIAVKVSRQCNKPRRDNMTDAAGYAATVQMCVEERERRGGSK